MQNHENTPNGNSFLSNSFDYLFDSPEDKALVSCLVRFIITGDRPATTPALWQDVAMYIRYKNRDVWALNDDQFKNTNRAIFIYRVKYIIEHLSKSEILECLNKFYIQKNDPHFDADYAIQPLHIFSQKLHAPVDSLFLTQEKLTIDQNQIKDLDKLFAYPCWLEFTDAALDEIARQILQNNLADEQLDYFLGATDNLKNYDKWFKIAKHILMTTNNPHVFWTAGDVLAIIRRAIPTDEKSQKWFNDQLFKIFWPRVGNVWPLQHENLIVRDTDKTQILTDSIGWLHTISDIKDRLENLDDNFIICDFNTDDTDFKNQKTTLLKIIKDKDTDPEAALNLFCTLANIATSPKTTKALRDFTETKFIPYIQTTNFDTKEVTKFINKAIKHAENYQKTLARERQNLAKLIK